MGEGPKNILLNFEDTEGLEKPCLKFVEVVKWYFEPGRKIQMAEAKAYSKLLSAYSKQDVSRIKEGGINSEELQTINFLLNSTNRKLKNVISIAEKSASELPDIVSDDPVEEDWLAKFFKYAEDVSDEQMQIIWGRILAGEVANPGTFSPRTINLISNLTKYEAEDFTDLCKSVWMYGALPVPFIYLIGTNKYIAGGNVNYALFSQFDSIGLAHFNNNNSFHFLEVDFHELSYHDFDYIISSESKRSIEFGCLMLTQEGQELFHIAGGETDEDYHEKVLDKIRKQGFSVEKVNRVIQVAD